MFSHAPLTNVSILLAVYVGFVWKANYFCPKVELRSKGCYNLFASIGDGKRTFVLMSVRFCLMQWW